MASHQQETREQSQLRAYAKKHVPRSALPALITPRVNPGSNNEPLPSLGDLQLLKEGRGVRPPTPPSEAESDDTEFVFEGRVCKEYPLNGKVYVMPEVSHEREWLHSRTTSGNRRLTYHLEVAQGPQRARACGSGMKSSADRRPVDPPPVVRLRVLEGDHDITAFYEATFMLFASLEHARPIANRTMYTTNHCPVLTGVTCAGAAYLTKPSTAAYFIFPDLSVRHEGWYRIKFHLFEQTKRREDFDADRLISTSAHPVEGSGQGSPPNDQEMMVNVTYVYSLPFQVYSAKKFPGLGQSTELSQIIAEQGCRVRIRKEVRQRKVEGKAGQKEEDQRSLRALSHDRAGSMDNQGYYGQPGPMGTRRPSMDSQVSQSYGPSRQPSYNPTALPSPNIAGPPSYYAQQTLYDAAGGPAQYVGEPQQMWDQCPAPIPPRNSNMGPPMPRVSYPPTSPATALPQPRLPSIESITNPTQPAKPEGGLYHIAPAAAQKRGYSRSSEERSSVLKDGARPQLTPSTHRNKYYAVAHDLQQSGNGYPLATGSDTIEADDGDDDEEQSDSDSYDDLLACKNPTIYRRANGTREKIPQLPYGQQVR